MWGIPVAVLLHDIMDPRDVDFLTWADRVVEVVFSTGSPPMPPFNEAHWQEWAERLYDNASWQQFNIPHPRAFDDWREWASWVKGTFP